MIASVAHPNCTLLCAIAGVSRSGYHAWRAHAAQRQQRSEQDQQDAEMIRIFCGNRIGICGYRGATMALSDNAIVMNHKKVARLMDLFGMQARIRKGNPYKKLFKKTEEHRTFENLLDRKFDQSIPERVGGTDITYLPWQGRFVYFSPIKDYASGEILAWNASLHIDMQLVMGMLDMFEERFTAEDLYGFMLHSDQGCHYTSPQYFCRLARYGMIQSMSRKGNCIDNASIESFFGHMKDEIDLSACRTFEEVVAVLATYVDEYNTTRRQWERKKMTPVQYKDHLFALATV